MSRAGKLRAIMLDWAKAIHEAIGIESPRLFVALFALIGFLFCGFMGWIIDRGYRVKIKEQSAQAATRQDKPPPKSVSPTENSLTKPLASKAQTKTVKKDSDSTHNSKSQNVPNGSSVTVHPGGAASFNQSGGITAGQVNITGSPAVMLTFANLPSNPDDERIYKTAHVSRVRIVLSGSVPEFRIFASSPTLTGFTIAYDQPFAASLADGQTPDGARFIIIQPAFGSYTFVLTSTVREQFQLRYDCVGVTCVKQ